MVRYRSKQKRKILRNPQANKKMVSEQTLRNLARGRSIRKLNLQNQKRNPLPKRPTNQKLIIIKKGQPIFRNFISQDLDVTSTDIMPKENIMAREDGILNLSDFIPKPLRRRR